MFRRALVLLAVLALCLGSWSLAVAQGPLVEAAEKPTRSLGPISDFGCTYCECMDICLDFGEPQSVCHSQCQLDCAPSHPAQR